MKPGASSIPSSSVHSISVSCPLSQWFLVRLHRQLGHSEKPNECDEQLCPPQCKHIHRWHTQSKMFEKNNCFGLRNLHKRNEMQCNLITTHVGIIYYHFYSRTYLFSLLNQTFQQAPLPIHLLGLQRWCTWNYRLANMYVWGGRFNLTSK